MKKVFMILIAAVLLLSMAGVVSADTQITNISVKDNATTTVTLDLGSKYTVTIPESVSISRQTHNNEEMLSGVMKISASISLLPSTDSLYVNVTSTNYIADATYSYNWTLIGQGANSGNNLTYYMSVSQYEDGGHIVGDVFTNPTSSKLLDYGEPVFETKTNVDKYIHMRVKDTPSNTGIYTDTLKFTVNIDTSTPPTP